MTLIDFLFVLSWFLLDHYTNSMAIRMAALFCIYQKHARMTILPVYCHTAQLQITRCVCYIAPPSSSHTDHNKYSLSVIIKCGHGTNASDWLKLTIFTVLSSKAWSTATWYHRTTLLTFTSVLAGARIASIWNRRDLVSIIVYLSVLLCAFFMWEYVPMNAKIGRLIWLFYWWIIWMYIKILKDMFFIL
jgi:hypothetical protein